MWLHSNLIYGIPPLVLALIVTTILFVAINLWQMHFPKEDRWYNLVKEAFTAEYAGQFFDTDALCRLLDDHYHGKANNGRKIWTVYTFLVWHEQFIGLKEA